MRAQHWPPGMASLPPAAPFFADAACRAEGVEVAWFFPIQGEQGDQAKKVCAECPAKLDCAEYAIAAGRRLQGIWGGLTAAERRTIRRDAAMSDLANTAASSNGAEPVPLEPEARPAALARRTKAPKAPRNDHQPEVSIPAPARSCPECGEPIDPAADVRRIYCSKTCGNRVAHRKRSAAVEPEPVALVVRLVQALASARVDVEAIDVGAIRLKVRL